LVTLLSTNDATSALPLWVNPSFLISLVGVHLVRLCIVIMGFTIKE